MRISRNRRQAGLTLIEVLVAVVILALGLIGVASLQLHGLRNVKVSGDLQAAGMHVNALVERMRLNKGNAAAYDALDSGTVDCAVADQATQDFCEAWTTLSQDLGPSVDWLRVTSCPDPDSVCVIQVQWTPRATYGVTTAAESRTFEMEVLL